MPLHLIEAPALRLESGYAAVFLKNETKLSDAFGIEFWFRPDRIPKPGFAPVLMLSFAVPARTVYAWIGLLDGEAVFGVYPDGGYTGQSIPLREKQWCHISAFYSNSGSKLDVTVSPPARVGEVRRAFDGPSMRFFGGAVKTIQIGGGFTTHLAQQTLGVETNGAFADLRLWGQAPAPGDIALRHQWRLAGNEPGLSGYWMMDEGDGTIFYDTSSNDNDGERIIRSYEWERKSGLELGVGSIDGWNANIVSMAGTADYTATTKRVDQLEAKRDAYQAEMGAISGRVSEVENESHALEPLEQQAQSDLEAQQSENEAQLKSKQDELNRLRNEIVQAEEAEEKKYQASNSIRLGEFITHVQQDMEESRRRIRSRYARVYGLDSLSLDLKMIPGFAGVGLQLPDPKKKTDASRLSTLTLDFRARPGEEDATPINAWVPQLEGSTELFARRKLTEAGFKVDTADQIVPEASGEHGRVLRQIYTETEKGKATLGSVIGLVIGRSH